MKERIPAVNQSKFSGDFGSGLQRLIYSMYRNMTARLLPLRNSSVTRMDTIYVRERESLPCPGQI